MKEEQSTSLNENGFIQKGAQGVGNVGLIRPIET